MPDIRSEAVRLADLNARCVRARLKADVMLMENQFALRDGFPATHRQEHFGDLLEREGFMRADIKELLGE